MIRFALLLLAVLLAASGVGCRKQPSTGPAPAPEPVGPSPIVLPAGSRPAGASLPAPNLARQLNDALHSFLELKGRMPNDLDELVKEKLIPAVPPPPPGRKYAIDANKLEVLLVSQ